MTRTGWIIAALGTAALALLAVLIFLPGRATAPASEAGNGMTNAAMPSREDLASGGRDAPPVEPVPADRPAAAPAPASVPPARVGECAVTTVESVGFRLEADGVPIPESGSAIHLANGVYGVSYDRVPAVDASRVGDRVRTCLVSIPQDCPPGDERGREYSSTNERTGRSWTLPDAQHMCGGA
jgi:hypothetical protein